MMDDISENQTIKGERRQKYSMEFKKATIKYAQENSIRSAAKKSKVNREWVQKEEKVTSMKGKTFRLDGGVRKLRRRARKRSSKLDTTTTFEYATCF